MCENLVLDHLLVLQDLNLDARDHQPYLMYRSRCIMLSLLCSSEPSSLDVCKIPHLLLSFGINIPVTLKGQKS